MVVGWWLSNVLFGAVNASFLPQLCNNTFQCHAIIWQKKHIFQLSCNTSRGCTSLQSALFSCSCSQFSQCGAGHSCSSVISLLLISHFKHKDNRFYYAFTTTVWTEALHCLMFPNVTYVFVSFFLCLMIPWLVTVTKKIFVYMISSGGWIM